MSIFVLKDITYFSAKKQLKKICNKRRILYNIYKVCMLQFKHSIIKVAYTNKVAKLVLPELSMSISYN